MASEMVIPKLEAGSGTAPVLAGAEVEARLVGLMSQVTVSQVYENRSAVNVEAVYTFPLPLDAALLGFEVELGDRHLRGHVVERQAAVERYEKAVAEGDSAVMLEQPEPGLYTANLGNLLPGEKAVLRYEYSELLNWQGDRLRFRLPTVVAPRYGNAAGAGLELHQEPDTDRSFAVEHRYRLLVVVEGALRDAELECPTHRVRVAREEERVVVEPEGELLMDRDFILNLRRPAGGGAGAVADRDVEGWLVVASFAPEFGTGESELPHLLKVVVDCSGSMAGDSISQAREAVRRVIEGMRPQDRFNIICFGTEYRQLFRRMLAGDERGKRSALQAVAGINADMGGTELPAALRAAYALPLPEGAEQCDVLVITDGEVWDPGVLAAEARASGHRVFTVGVGSAVNERTVRELADSSGGACELVVPNEAMAPRVERLFRRMRLPKAARAVVDWGVTPDKAFPNRLPAVFSGDTVHVQARFAEQPAGPAWLRIWLDDGTEVEQAADIFVVGDGKEGDDSSLPGPVARVGAAARLRSICGRPGAWRFGRGSGQLYERAVELAVRYQLVSPVTNYLVVLVRPDGEKALTEPELRKVSQMMAAGWHGLGTVHLCDVQFSARPVTMDLALSDGPCFLRRGIDETGEVEDASGDALADLVLELEYLAEGAPDNWLSGLDRLDALKLLGLPAGTAGLLEGLVQRGVDERMVVLAVLTVLARRRAGRRFSKDARQDILEQARLAAVPKELQDEVRRILRMVA